MALSNGLQQGLSCSEFITYSSARWAFRIVQSALRLSLSFFGANAALSATQTLIYRLAWGCLPASFATE